MSLPAAIHTHNTFHYMPREALHGVSAIHLFRYVTHCDTTQICDAESVGADAEDLDWIRTLTPPRVLLGRFLLEDRLSAGRSITGFQLEQAELGLSVRGSSGGGRNVAELLAARLATLTAFCVRLRAVEEKVCRARYGAVAGIVGYTAIRLLCDILEGDGEEIVDLRPKDLDGRPLQHSVQVRGVRARFPSYEEIGAAAGLTAHQVRYLLDAARSKIGRALRHKALQQ